MRQIIGKAIADLGRLDVLVCLGTKASLREIDQIDQELLRAGAGREHQAVFFLTQACVPALRSTRGSVVHVGSSRLNRWHGRGRGWLCDRERGDDADDPHDGTRALK